MDIELTTQQEKALEDRQEFPPRIVNPRTKETFVLLPMELYDRVRAQLEEEDEILAVRETYPLVT